MTRAAMGRAVLAGIVRWPARLFGRAVVGDALVRRAVGDLHRLDHCDRSGAQVVDRDRVIGPRDKDELCADVRRQVASVPS